MPNIEFWPNRAFGPRAKPDRFEVSDAEGDRIMEEVPQDGCLSFTDKNGDTCRVFLGRYRYVRRVFEITYLPPTRS